MRNRREVKHRVNFVVDYLCPKVGFPLMQNPIKWHHFSLPSLVPPSSTLPMPTLRNRLRSPIALVHDTADSGSANESERCALLVVTDRMLFSHTFCRPI